MRTFWPALLIACLMLTPAAIVMAINWHLNRLDALPPAPTTGDTPE